MTIAPELLAAYADGELDGDDARAVEAAIAADPALQTKLAAHRALRSRLSARFAPIAEEPVPDRLVQAATSDGQTAEVIDFAVQARRRRGIGLPQRWARIAGPALAASLVLALVGINLQRSESYAGGDLARMLDTQLVATQRPDAPLRILLSFRAEDGLYCRGFTTRTQSGIACRDERGWRLRKFLDGSEANPSQYRQAGNPDQAIIAAIEAMTAGPALDAGEEQQAVRAGWQAGSRAGSPPTTS